MIKEIKIRYKRLENTIRKIKQSLNKFFNARFKLVGVELLFLCEDSDMLVEQGWYAKGFKKEDYEK